MSSKLRMNVYRDREVEQEVADRAAESLKLLGRAASYLEIGESSRTISLGGEQWTPQLADRTELPADYADINIILTPKHVVDSLYRPVLGSALRGSAAVGGIGLVRSDISGDSIPFVTAHEIGHMLGYENSQGHRGTHCPQLGCLMYHRKEKRISYQIQRQSKLEAALVRSGLRPVKLDRRESMVLKQFCDECASQLGRRAAALARHETTGAEDTWRITAGSAL